MSPFPLSLPQFQPIKIHKYQELDNSSMVTAIQVPQDLSGLKIGILGLQGAFVEHLAALKRVEPSIESIIIREPSQLDESLDGIIIPGGESTTMTIVAQNYGLFPGLKEWVSSQKPIMVKQYCKFPTF